MSRIVTNAIRLTVVLLFVCGMFGCATNPKAHRYYSGPPLQHSEVALIYTVGGYLQGGCQIIGMRGESDRNAKKLSGDSSNRLELLPGRYIANVLLLYQRSGSTKYDLKADLNLNVQAGNIYVIYPEIEGKDPKNTFKEFMWGKELGMAWRPIVVNLNDYNDEECSDSRYKLSCPIKDDIRKWVANYLQGERHAISYHPSNVIVVNGQQLDVGDVWY